MMTEITKPTPKEIRDAWMEATEDFEQVHEEADPSWRHGCYMHTVFKRIADNTFWAVNWQCSGDGEYNTLRDEVNSIEVFQVEPKEVTTTIYTALKS
jgi:hypothetical protein